MIYLEIVFAPSLFGSILEYKPLGMIWPFSSRYLIKNISAFYLIVQQDTQHVDELWQMEYDIILTKV